MAACILGLDIGSNSVGSAWIDTEKEAVYLGCSVFPAGVEDSEDKRGAPKNQARRTCRGQRRQVARRAALKRRLRKILLEHGLCPKTPMELREWESNNPWQLRKRGLDYELTPHEFGRVLLHMAQRRGAAGIIVENAIKEVVAPKSGFIKAVFVEIEQCIENKQPLFVIAKEDVSFNEEQIVRAQEGKTPRGGSIIKASGLGKRKGNVAHIEVLPGDYVEPGQLLCEIHIEKADSDEGKIKQAINATTAKMHEYGVRTYGELMYMLYEKGEREVGEKEEGGKKKKVLARNPIRNRQNALGESVYEYCADREMLASEFNLLWNKQKEYGGALSKLLTPELRKKLYYPKSDKTWRCKGAIFGQRNTYWKMGSLGRCDLEPTDQRCPKGDMYAQEFLVLETLNNIRITEQGNSSQPLKDEDRERVLELLRTSKSVSVAGVRKVLGINRGHEKSLYTLSLDSDPKRKLNTNWFYREIISGAIGVDKWNSLPDKVKESINAALLKFDPQREGDADKLGAGCTAWWGLTGEQGKRVVAAWRKRPKKEDRVNLSRKAIKNLLPYLREKYSVTEARQLFAEDPTNGASDEQRSRYSLGSKRGNKKMRQFMEKHPGLLPPVPGMLSNPVVRKAIFEVRRHVQAYVTKFGKKPDRVIVELARAARQTAKVRNEQLRRNREREELRREIREKYGLDAMSSTQREKAIKRVLLCREQKFQSAYSDRCISEKLAAEDTGKQLEIDHIIPKSKGGPNGLNNRLLCYTKENRGKGSKTLKEWLSNEEYGALEQRLGHLKKDNPIKWENLHKDVKDMDGFVESQLIDTAYASKQVITWLESALYGDEKEKGLRCVFATKGHYTAQMRRDLGLFPDREDGTRQDKKNRADHRHHALDAVAIALSGPENLTKLAKAYETWEQAKSDGYDEVKREPIAPPWGTVESFRRKVMEKYRALVVCHRPVNRKITGELHKANPLGTVVVDGELQKKLCTKRIFVGELTSNHLRVPPDWKKLAAELRECKTKGQAKAIRRRMLKEVEDCKPGKSGIIRDRWFRQEIRECLQANGLNPDALPKNAIKQLIKNGGMKLKSGVPIRRITLLMADTTVPIKRRRWNYETQQMEYDPDPSTTRLYQPQSNHHIEIREDKNGKWNGEVIRTYDAIRRVNPSKASGMKPQAAVDRNNTDKGKFVMSLAIGEMVYMKHTPVQGRRNVLLCSR